MWIEKLEARGATVAYTDPYVPVIPLTREHAHYAGRKSVALPDIHSPITDNYDLILVSTAHDEYRAIDFSGLSCPVVDTRNSVSKRPPHYYRS